MKHTAKTFSLLLTLVMLLSLLPGMSLTAYAEATTVTWSGAGLPTSPYTDANGIGMTGSMSSHDWYSDTMFYAPSGMVFTRIEISHKDWMTWGDTTWTWSGRATEVSIVDTRYEVSKATFTLEPASVAVTGVTFDKTTAQTIEVDGSVSFTATVSPDNATDKKVVWSVGGTNASAVTLYSDADCTQAVGADATETLTVYAKGMSAGSATVTATSNADDTKSASCDVTVNLPPHTHSFTYTASGDTITATCQAEGCDLTENKVTLTIGDPTNIYYDDKTSPHDFTLTGLEGFNNATGKTISVSDIVYYKGDYQSSDIKNNNVKGATYRARLTVEGAMAEHSFKFTSKPIPHTHDFTYTANGAVITATCTGTTGTCDLPNKQATLTLNAPLHTAYGDGKDADATFSGEIPGVNNPTIYYSKGDVTLNAAPTDAGTYKAWCQLGNATASVTYIVAQAQGAYTEEPAARTLTYTGEAQNLVTDGTANGGQIAYAMSYSPDESADMYYTYAIPQATDAGTYYVWYKLEGGKNYTSIAAQKLEVTISPADMTVSAEGYSNTYDGNTHGITVTVTVPTSGYTVRYGTSEGNYDQTANPSYADAGTYTVYYQVSAPNYNSKSGSATVTISRADLSPSVSLEGWAANESAKTPVVTGNSGNGAVTYTYAVKGTENFSETVPTTAGDYTVKASIAQTTNYNAATATADFTIGKAVYTVSFSGAEIDAQTVTDGEKATEPTEPTKARTAFDGWYSDAECTVPFNFETPITANTTVYVKWTPVAYQLKSVTGATEDSGHTWYKDSTADVVLTFKTAQEPDVSFAHFVGFEIDGKPFPHTAKEGSTVVTLRPADLKTLAVGAHTATAVYDNGTASTRLTIGESSASPKTGDTNNAALWLGLLLVSGLALGVGAFKLSGRKKYRA